MTSCRAQLLLALAGVGACDDREKPLDAKQDSVAAAAAVTADTGMIQERADWPAFAQALPKDPQGATLALERYRRDHGLPFDFFLRPDLADTLTRALRTQEDEMGCGALVRAFVREIPRDHPILMALPAMEFDSAGRTLRRWPLPGETGFFQLVVGVVGEDLILSYPNATAGVFMRIKPDGGYAISAQPPPPLAREEWIEVADSTWLRVRPRDEGTFTRYPSGTRPEPVGTWVPSGDSGWYVRTDSVPGQRSRARATTLSGDPSPRMVMCPAPAEFEGMICRGFPEGEREHRIAYPMPCT